MKKAIELADTTFRAYKKGNGKIALHLRTYLIVCANADFRAKIRNAMPSLKLDEPDKPAGLSAFMKEHPRCWLQLPGREQRECALGYSCYALKRTIERPTGTGYVTYEFLDIGDQESLVFHCSARMTVRNDNLFGKGNTDRLIIANMRMVFEINFPNRPPGEKVVIRRKVAVVGHGWIGEPIARKSPRWLYQLSKHGQGLRPAAFAQCHLSAGILGRQSLGCFWSRTDTCRVVSVRGEKCRVFGGSKIGVEVTRRLRKGGKAHKTLAAVPTVAKLKLVTVK